MTQEEAHNSLTMHGVFLEVMGVGVLLTGASGIGKSEIALSLINRGHRLIADDAVLFNLVNDETIVGHCPPLLQDFLEVRGLGILNIRVMFGDTAIKENKRLQLVVRLAAMESDELIKIDRLYGMYRSQSILNIATPEVTIPVASGRNLSVLVEGAVRNQVLKNTGYNASEEFANRQAKIMEQESGTFDN